MIANQVEPRKDAQGGEQTRDKHLRILHILRTLDPAAGGPPNVAVRLAAAQVELGHEVQVAYYASSSGLSFDSAYSRILHVDRVIRREFPLLGRWERFSAREAGKALRSLLPTFDIVHLHEMWQPILWTAANLAWNSRIPYVLTPHGMLDPWCLRQKRIKKQAALAVGWRGILKRAAFLHVLNEDEGRLLEPLGLNSRRITIPNGVSLEELNAATGRDYFEQSLGIPGNRTVLFLGRLHYKKGLDYLAAAFALLLRTCPDAHLVVVGPDEGARSGFLSDAD